MTHQPNLIVVTGATGFTGKFVVRALRERFPGARLRCFVRASSDVSELQRHAVEIVVGDLSDVASLRAAFTGADTLVHAASLGFGWADSVTEAMRGSSIRRGVFISTTAIFTRLPVKSRPIRERAEALIRDSDISWTILRPTMIYGTPRDRNVARLIRFVSRWPVVPIVAADALQQPVHVADVAAAVADVVANERTIGRAYNLSGRDPLPLADLVRKTAEAVGRPRLFVRLPWGLILAGTAAYNRLTPLPRITVEQVRRLRENKNFDHSDATRDFGFTPRSFEEGVRDEIRMIREFACERATPSLPPDSPPVIG